MVSNMKIPIKIILIIIPFILFSCKTEYVIGEYGKIGKGGKTIPYVYYLNLNADSTFTYSYGVAWTKKVSTGTWDVNLKRKELMLNSYVLSMDSIPINVDESYDINMQSRFFIFRKPIQRDLTAWFLILGDGTSYKINSDTISIPKETTVDNFYIMGYQDTSGGLIVVPKVLQDTIITLKHKVTNSNNNVYNITFPQFICQDIFYYNPMKDTLKIKRNALMWEKEKVKLKKIKEK